MLVPIQWLKKYTKVDVSVEEFCDRMIMSGSNLETVEYIGEGIQGVVVGKILSIEKHPDADKLVVTQVDVGQEEPLQIVTGAKNIAVGNVVPIAMHGSKVPGPLHGQPKVEGGVTIKKGKLRGIVSNGMMCSAQELGFEDKVVPVAHKDGIWILPEDLTPGMDLTEALNLCDAVVDFEITPNRPDCLSMIGMAREAAATFDTELVYPDTACQEKGEGKAADEISVTIKRPDLCKRYAARVVTDVKVEQSPWWMQQCLMSAGMRPINNIVDITNFVMLEYGQPLHAFDINSVAGRQIIVDAAGEGETFVTLDGSERTLAEDMLLIKDAEKGIAIAGVMGGLNSEITDDTTTILIESACFNCDSIRSASKKLGLRTEASSRYEKGIDPNLAGAACERVCHLIELLGAGTVLKGVVDEYPQKEEAKAVEVRVKRVNDMLGINITGEEMAKILRGLEMDVVLKDGVMTVTHPTVRQDLETEVDYVEEVGRMYGYDRLPATLPKSSNSAGKTKKQLLRDLARDSMIGMGATEIQTYSFVSPKGLDYIKVAADAEERKLVKLINPLGEDTSVMRTTLIPNMMEVLARNYSRSIPSVAAFEIGNTFIDIHPGGDILPEEQDAMSFGVYGNNTDFFTLKGMVAELLAKMGIKDCEFVPESTVATFHPGRCAQILYKGENIGIIGEIHPDVTEKYNISARVICCELAFERLVDLSDTEKLYRPLPKHPAVVRDIALIVEEDVTVASLEAVIKKNGDSILESVELFDVYRGKQIQEGTKSVAFTLTYRAQDRTLVDEEVTKVNDNVIKALEEECSAVLRDM